MSSPIVTTLEGFCFSIIEENGGVFLFPRCFCCFARVSRIHHLPCPRLLTCPSTAPAPAQPGATSAAPLSCTGTWPSPAPNAVTGRKTHRQRERTGDRTKTEKYRKGQNCTETEKEKKPQNQQQVEDRDGKRKNGWGAGVRRKGMRKARASWTGRRTEKQTENRTEVEKEALGWKDRKRRDRKKDGRWKQGGGQGAGRAGRERQAARQAYTERKKRDTESGQSRRQVKIKLSKTEMEGGKA